MDNFERSMVFILKWEGGYSNDANDSGGETKHGISKRAYPDIDITNLTEEKAKEIYRRDYWEKAGCSSLAWPMCLVVFDTAVNCGVGKALELSKTFGDNWFDYLIGRMKYYVKISESMKNRYFLRGWLNRCLDLYQTIKENAHPLNNRYNPDD